MVTTIIMNLSEHISNIALASNWANIDIIWQLSVINIITISADLLMPRCPCGSILHI